MKDSNKHVPNSIKWREKKELTKCLELFNSKNTEWFIGDQTKILTA